MLCPTDRRRDQIMSGYTEQEVKTEFFNKNIQFILHNHCYDYNHSFMGETVYRRWRAEHFSLGYFLCSVQSLKPLLKRPTHTVCKLLTV